MEHLGTDVIDHHFKAMGLVLTYSRHVDERNVFHSSSIASRVKDLHEIFAVGKLSTHRADLHHDPKNRMDKNCGHFVGVRC